MLLTSGPETILASRLPFSPGKFGLSIPAAHCSGLEWIKCSSARQTDQTCSRCTWGSEQLWISACESNPFSQAVVWTSKPTNWTNSDGFRLKILCAHYWNSASTHCKHSFPKTQTCTISAGNGDGRSTVASKLVRAKSVRHHAAWHFIQQACTTLCNTKYMCLSVISELKCCLKCWIALVILLHTMVAAPGFCLCIITLGRNQNSVHSLSRHKQHCIWQVPQAVTNKQSFYFPPISLKWS